MDLRLLGYFGWALATLVIYGLVFQRVIGKYRHYHDDRARREFLTVLALFITALVSFVSLLTLFLWAPGGVGLRGVLTFIALGSFTGAGVVWLQETPRDEA
jgi:hypothetical protein